MRQLMIFRGLAARRTEVSRAQYNAKRWYSGFLNAGVVLVHGACGVSVALQRNCDAPTL